MTRTGGETLWSRLQFTMHSHRLSVTAVQGDVSVIVPEPAHYIAYAITATGYLVHSSKSA